MADQRDDLSGVSISELMGEHRPLPGDGEAMFEVEEVAMANTVLRGARLMLEDRLGAEAARPLTTVLAWAQSIVIAAVLDDGLDGSPMVSPWVEALRERLALGNDPLAGMPFRDALEA